MTSHTAAVCRHASVERLRNGMRHAADHVVAYAHTAQRLGDTAESYRMSAAMLEDQADHAAALLFSQAAEICRAVAVFQQLIAETLEDIESRMDLQGFPSPHHAADRSGTAWPR